nr:glycosyltransferase [Solirubrobacterales bacterium]
DEVVVADNTPQGVFGTAARNGLVRVVHAHRERSSYHARNVGAEAARHEWILFTDSDCRPAPDILDAYFSAPIADDVGGVVGPVHPLDDGATWVSRYAVTRQENKQAMHLRNSYKPFGATANLLARRVVWSQLGGFHEGIRSGGDVDFSWRLQDAGWRLDYREEAAVAHEQRESVKALVRQFARYGSGRRWVNLRHPGSRMRPRITRPVARCFAAAGYWLLRGSPRKAGYKLVDALVITSEAAGSLLANRSTAGDPPAAEVGARRRITILVDTFPEVSETFIVTEAHELAALGIGIHVESSGRARRPDPSAARDLDVCFLEDDAPLRKLADTAWVVARHPALCLRDLRDRARWRVGGDQPLPLRSIAPLARRCERRGDEMLHAHFAAGAALTALRVGRLIDRPYSVTAHGYDIFRIPRNLPEKLERAAFATSGSDFTVAALRDVTPNGRIDLHRVVMGVDGERWRRETPYTGDGPILAVGRLVEKKGFSVLLDAAARMGRSGQGHPIAIVGEGPLRPELEAQHAALHLGEHVALAGSRSSDEVRALLERAAVLVVPCVIAADGDADSMPVIVKEALAMEVPVVSSDAAGLPEVVREDWGRLVAAGDAAALAAALAEVLALPVAERRDMGRRGRSFVLEHCNAAGEAQRLARLIDDAVARA